MNANEMVPTKETCKRLKEAGFAQDTVFCWANSIDLETQRNAPAVVQRSDWTHGAPAAPTLAEILRVLPRHFPDDYPYNRLSLVLFPVSTGRWEISYGGQSGIRHERPAEAAARLWLALRETALAKEVPP